VAVPEEVPARHFDTGAPLTLRRGQIGTVVMTYDGSAFEVELSDAQGRAFAMLPIQSHRDADRGEIRDRAPRAHEVAFGQRVERPRAGGSAEISRWRQPPDCA